MKKVIFVATVVKKHISVFHLPFLKMFKENGYETCVCASNDYDSSEELVIPYCDRYFDFPFERSPLRINNFFAYKKLKQLLVNENYDLIHCHTPIAAMITRLAARQLRKSGTRVMYTAHGFHFFKGAPLLNWLVYFPVEWICSFFTDVLITINQEDYQFAKKHMHAKKIYYVPGVGIDLEKYQNIQVDRIEKRKEIGVPEDAIAVVSVGELNENKNHKVIVEAIAKLKRNDVYYVICGVGDQKENLEQLAMKLGIEKQVILLGYRSDIAEINQCCDIFAFPSKREGLGLAAIEAMAVGLPIVTSNIHGIVDYSINGVTGFNYNPTDVNGFSEGIKVLINDKNLRLKMGMSNQKVVMNFSLNSILEKMKHIYKDLLREGFL